MVGPQQQIMNQEKEEAITHREEIKLLENPVLQSLGRSRVFFLDKKVKVLITNPIGRL